MVGAPSWRIGGSLVRPLQLTASGGARGFGKAQSIRGKGWLCSAQTRGNSKNRGCLKTVVKDPSGTLLILNALVFFWISEGAKAARTSERRHHVRSVQKWPP